MTANLPPLATGASFYSVEQVADWLRVTPQTIRNWCREGVVVGHKIGKLWRISPENLEKAVKAAYAKAGH